MITEISKLVHALQISPRQFTMEDVQCIAKMNVASVFAQIYFKTKICIQKLKFHSILLPAKIMNNQNQIRIEIHEIIVAGNRFTSNEFEGIFYAPNLLGQHDNLTTFSLGSYLFLTLVIIEWFSLRKIIQIYIFDIVVVAKYFLSSGKKTKRKFLFN